MSQPERQLPPVNIRALLRDVIDSQLYSLLLPGVYSGDPHPGNILCMPDGRLGLIDFGQVGRLSVDQRCRLAHLWLALHERQDRPNQVAAAYANIGMKTQSMKPDTLYKHAEFYYNQDTPEMLAGTNVFKYLQDMDAEDPLTHIPPELVLAGRAILIVKSFGLTFNLRPSIAEAAVPYARQLFKQYPKEAAATEPDWHRFDAVKA
eukprot:NODE_791_length_1643_cov_75.719657_g781_i0.p2 GENE.NODE_791_length_1643_cov_75.719657_g781_i0~~NODE_791_length_1643_cov_75.719657_g781_i0.p2  ORF type:complete len:205 (+),score=49.22 NODE_791_length_1643_cov_75.719657_g781_i0:975-1589(+)